MILLFLISTLMFIVNGISLESRIVGGDETKIENHPYQVSIQINGIHWCGGSIISNRYILTAAHCVIFSLPPLTIRAGSSYHAEGGSYHEVINEIVHENWADAADIAILEIVPSFIFDNTRQPVSLTGHNVKLNAGTLANVTGWGQTQESESGPSNILQIVQVPIVEHEICNNAYMTTAVGKIIDGQICAGWYGQGQKDACQGDSGGPLVIDGYQVGVVSRGMGCAKPDYPGIYADVGYFRQWIYENTGV